MLQTILRLALAATGTALVMVVADKYYAPAVECLAHVERLAHAAVPAILALALVYHVIRDITRS